MLTKFGSAQFVVVSLKQGMFSKPKPLQAIGGVSLRLHKKDVLGLVGESGCGKSTLAKILLGLEQPTSGEVLVDGKEIGPADRQLLARRIQPIFQDPYSSLNPRKSIYDIISLPLRVHSIGDSASQRKAVKDMLDVVGLPQRVMNTYPSQMSGGQRQRVGIARAIALKPDFILADEIVSGLDVSSQAQVLNLLESLVKDLGLTLAFISHDLSVIRRLCTRILVLYKGEIVENSETAELFANPKADYTRTLLDAIPLPDPKQAWL